LRLLKQFSFSSFFIERAPSNLILNHNKIATKTRLRDASEEVGFGKGIEQA